MCLAILNETNNQIYDLQHIRGMPIILHGMNFAILLFDWFTSSPVSQVPLFDLFSLTVCALLL